MDEPVFLCPTDEQVQREREAAAGGVWEWVAVSQRLPQPGAASVPGRSVEVVVLGQQGGEWVHGIAAYEWEKGQWAISTGALAAMRVVYWMPLPPRPL
ncbi:MAG TPA: hypothetical protein VF707_09760 [Ardenticatenaceae bacterium]|jgi:hypothetical protein